MGDYQKVVMASPTTPYLSKWPSWNVEGTPAMFDQDFWSNDAANEIHHEAISQSYSFFEKLPFTLVVNVIEFQNLEP